MHLSRTVEILVGLFVAIGLVALFFLSMQVSNLAESSNSDGYSITARFENIGSLKVRSPVTMAGVRIGRVSGIEFDKDNYEAIVTMSIGAQYDTLPEDTSASIFTAGLLGEQYIGLEPGAEELFLKDGGQITLTQSSLVLEQIIGQFLFSKASEGGQ